MEDGFKCVWCKESYQTLEGLTTHIKEAKHHSLPYPLPNSQSLPGRVPPASSPLCTSVASMSMASPASSTQSTSPKPAPVRDVLKEQLPLPRKLHPAHLPATPADPQSRPPLQVPDPALPASRPWRDVASPVQGRQMGR